MTRFARATASNSAAASSTDGVTRVANPPASDVLTSRQMRAAEQALFARGVDSFELMKAAGIAVATAVREGWPRQPVTILAGPGNNGGDGFIAAEMLRQAGQEVTVLAVRSRDAYSGDAARAAAFWQGEIQGMDATTLRSAILPNCVVIDGLFGIGLSRAMPAIAAEAMRLCHQLNAPVIAVDIPSGISADTGQVMGAAMLARETITFGWAKPGHLLYPGRAHAGRLTIVGLGLDAACAAAARSGTDEPVLHSNDPALWLSSLPRVGPLDHKYSRGHALVFGSQEMPGAGRLAARAARRIGTGMLSVAAPAEILPQFQFDQPGLIAKPASRPEDVVEILLDSRISGVLVGAGMLPVAATREAVLNVLASARPAVVDGGGLTAFADRPQDLFGLGRGDVVLTPHEGEFMRLFPDLGPHLGKVERVREASRRSRCIIVLKGADTAISDGQRCVINIVASPHLATAGSGDVLAGLVVGLLAQGMPAFGAAAASVWLHGSAGVAAGAGMIAEDLPERIPELLRGLGL